MVKIPRLFLFLEMAFMQSTLPFIVNKNSIFYCVLFLRYNDEWRLAKESRKSGILSSILGIAPMPYFLLISTPAHSPFRSLVLRWAVRT